jgi:hypothetical protein
MSIIDGITLTPISLFPIKASDAKINKRLEICNTCSNKKTYLGKVDYCGLCKCPLRSATYLEHKKCPDLKW